MTDLRKIQTIQKKFILERKWERFNGTQVLTHLIEELGEIGSYLLYDEKYKVKGAGHENKENNIESEFAQSFVLFLQLAILAKVDLESAWEKEIKLMEKRFPKDIWQELAEKS